MNDYIDKSAIDQLYALADAQLLQNLKSKSGPDFEVFCHAYGDLVLSVSLDNKPLLNGFYAAKKVFLNEAHFIESSINLNIVRDTFLKISEKMTAEKNSGSYQYAIKHGKNLIEKQ